MLVATLALLLRSFLLLWTVSVSPQNQWLGVIRGTLDRDQVYAFGTAMRVHPGSQKVNQLSTRAAGGGMLSVHSASIQRGAVSNQWVPILVEWFESPYAPLRWQFLAGQFHVVRFWPLKPDTGPRHGNFLTFSPADLELCPSFPVDRRPQEEKIANMRLFQARVLPRIGLGPYHTHFDDVRIIKDVRRPQVYFDFLDYKIGGYELFVFAQGKVTRSCIELPQNGREPDWVKKETWTADWTGPFYVASNGDDRFIVTETGRIFAVPLGAKAGAALKEVWPGKSPVNALIHDSEAKKFYAFTRDQYFEVAADIKPKPHSLALCREWTANKALETATKCGQVIRGLPEPKPK